jgi:hypothetical protein
MVKTRSYLLLRQNQDTTAKELVPLLTVLDGVFGFDFLDQVAVEVDAAVQSVAAVQEIFLYTGIYI